MSETPLLYLGLSRVAHAAVSLFYSHVEITGLEHVDPTKPTIYAPTHPNSIIDPLLITLFEDRPLRFVARDGLFRVPGFGAVLRAVGAIPVRRRMDHPGGEQNGGEQNGGEQGGAKVDNAGALAACVDALRAGGALVLFPEGKTHARLRVEPIKTGAARIALDAEDGARGVRVVPVGLNYLVRHAFRSDVHIGIGAPIELDPELRALERGDAVRELTERVQESLEALTVHVEREDDERMIAQVTTIIAELREKEGLDPYGQSPAERVALVQRIVDLIEEREALGLGGERPALQHRSERRRVGRIWREERRSILVLGAPLAAYGMITHLVPYLALRALLWVRPPRFYRGALAKVLLGGLFFAAFYAATSSALWGLAGPVTACVYAMSLLPAGLFARRYLVEMRLHRLGSASMVQLLFRRSRLSLFKAERQLVADELAALRERYLAATEPSAAE
jgi:1-acyl-sn-glycerol-3-phosphate acyltransferase